MSKKFQTSFPCEFIDKLTWRSIFDSLFLHVSLLNMRAQKFYGSKHVRALARNIRELLPEVTWLLHTREQKKCQGATCRNKRKQELLLLITTTTPSWSTPPGSDGLCCLLLFMGVITGSCDFFDRYAVVILVSPEESEEIVNSKSQLTCECRNDITSTWQWVVHGLSKRSTWCPDSEEVAPSEQELRFLTFIILAILYSCNPSLPKIDL